MRQAAFLAARLLALTGACLALANCANNKQSSESKYGVSASARVVEPGQPVPKGGGAYRVGKPYVVAGRTYVPEENATYRGEGVASWYGDDFHGRLTANGEVYDMNGLSAAHPTLPMPSYVRVTNLRNQRSLVVRVNDRGPFERDREIDLSMQAAKMLDFHGQGTARVRVEYVGRAPLEGSDDRKLMATLRERGKPIGGETRLARSLEREPATFAAAAPQRPEPKPAKPQVQVASAEPSFAPEFFDSTPMTRRGGPVPNAASNNVQSLPAVARETPRMATAGEPFATRYPAVQSVPGEVTSPSTARNTPVSAYATPRYDGSAGAVSGRGLY